MNFERFGRRGLLLAACATSVLATPAFAQQQATTVEDEQPVEEIIVTATRRETALQNVAVAVTAIGTQAIETAGVKDIRDLTQLAPSLQVPVSENSGAVTARIRGIGTQGSNPGLESSVGVVVDGVFRARNGVAFGDLGEIRAIEVLRGPQGTLFGRNTSAGLIMSRLRSQALSLVLLEMQRSAITVWAVLASASLGLSWKTSSLADFMSQPARATVI